MILKSEITGDSKSGNLRRFFNQNSWAVLNRNFLQFQNQKSDDFLKLEISNCLSQIAKKNSAARSGPRYTAHKFKEIKGFTLEGIKLLT